MEKNLYEIAADLLEAIWQGMDSDFKRRYRQTIWEQFENRVRSASYTNNLGKFTNSLCLKTGAMIPAKCVAQAESILNSGNDKLLLKLYREETTRIVLMVQLRNQERREAWDAKQKERDLFDQLTPEELFKETEETEDA